MAPKRPQSSVKKLGFSLLATALFLASLELCLRVIFGPPPPPVKVFSGLQPIDEYFEVKDGVANPVFQIWASQSGNFRTEPSGPRVAFLGGSSVHGGSGLETRDEFPALIGQGLGIDTINLGSPGMDSHDVVRIAEEIVAWPWSAFVVYTGHNDFGNAWFQERYGSASAGLEARAVEVMGHFQLFSTLNRALTVPDGVAHSARDPNGPQLKDNEHAPLDDERQAVAASYLKANLERVVWLCKRHDIPLVLVIPTGDLNRGPIGGSCSTEPCAAVVWREANELSNRDPVAARAALIRARDIDPAPLRAPTLGRETVREVAAEAGAGVWLVDPEVSLPQDTRFGIPPEWVYQDQVHFSRAGHVAMAELLAPVVAEALASKAP